MPTEETATSQAHPEQTVVRPPAPDAYEPLGARPEWSEDRVEELPRRPRRRLLAPAPLALLAVLLTACGFIAGVLVEKGQGSSSSSAGGAASLASRLAGLRRGAGAGAAGVPGAGSASSGGGAGGRATIGSVAYVAGDSLYVTDSEGNTVKVTTSPATSVTKTVTAALKSIHPGETVTIAGTQGANGAISAESIRVGGAGGLAALFGGGTSGRGSSGGAGAGAGASGGGGGGNAGAGAAGGQALFGSGG